MVWDFSFIPHTAPARTATLRGQKYEKGLKLVTD
jgi:hypothetical protein